MVEFVLVAPLLVLLVFGIIQFGILLNNYVTLTDAVRAGARQASVSRTLPDPVGSTNSRIQKAAVNLGRATLRSRSIPTTPSPGRTTGRRVATSP